MTSVTIWFIEALGYAIAFALSFGPALVAVFLFVTAFRKRSLRYGIFGLIAVMLVPVCFKLLLIMVD